MKTVKVEDFQLKTTASPHLGLKGDAKKTPPRPIFCDRARRRPWRESLTGPKGI
jgi:hypothetical protein